MYKDNMAENAAVEEIAATSDETDTADNGDAAVESKDTFTETQAFSKRLKEKTQAEVDNFVSSMGITNPYTGERVTTRAQYEEYQQMVAADDAGADPRAAAETMRLRSQLADYQAREEDIKLKSDPTFGPYYSQYRDELIEIQRNERANGNDLSLEMLLRAKLAADLPSILADIGAKAKGDALAAIQANATASPGSSGGAATGNMSTYATMPDAEFDKLLRRAINGELKKS